MFYDTRPAIGEVASSTPGYSTIR